MAGIRSYLAGALIPKSDNLLTWWKARQVVYENFNGHYEEEIVHSCKICACRENIFKNWANYFREEEQAETQKSQTACFP